MAPEPLPSQVPGGAGPRPEDGPQDVSQEPGSVSIEAAVSPAAKKMLDTTRSQLGYLPPAKDGDPWTMLDDAWRTPFRAAPDGTGTVRARLGGQVGLDKDAAAAARLQPQRLPRHRRLGAGQSGDVEVPVRMGWLRPESTRVTDDHIRCWHNQLA